ncbi:single-stranded DNA-binding protein [Actinomyces sp.]|uniref:single-stranded DNA-binding protein n=1 Tax=Actinomyces sp. TaxID=29317 RepID=UPI0026DA7646|nr:single-stranded DNA-binding protein [Actinomyces sp.]MDO4899045.1 single-stranded DNA-binding protein [Actinomyces sp.]
MSRQLDLVVQGVLGTNPAVTRTAGGRPYCYFRVATSPSFRTAQGWRDGQTIWFTAKSWGPLAENLGRSLHKGDPVVLVGRFSQESWSKGTDEFLTNVLTVSCGGHDLTRGESRFMRIVHASAAPEADQAGTQEPSVTTSSSGSAPTADSALTPDEVSQAVGQTPPEGQDRLPADHPAGAYQTPPHRVEETGTGGAQEHGAVPATGGELADYVLADEDE